MDIIVTTPKRQRKAAEQEAAACLAAGGGTYFRRFPVSCYPIALKTGDRVYYVEDGAIRGFLIVKDVQPAYIAQRCDTTGREWEPGIYVFMDATTWRWIRPISMKGFQGFRYIRETHFRSSGQAEEVLLADGWWDVEMIGSWRAPRPAGAADGHG